VRRAFAVLALLLATTTACDAKDLPTPNETKIDVNTPKLRQLKQQAGVEDCVPGTGEAVDGGLPALTLPCFGGGADVDLATLRGPMIVNLWGSWCGPCRKEMPVLARFHDRYGDQVPLLGLDYGDPQTESAMALVKKSGVHYPLLADPGGVLAEHAPFSPRMALPINVFVAEDGTVTLVPGGVDSLQELVDLVREHLGIAL